MLGSLYHKVLEDANNKEIDLIEYESCYIAEYLPFAEYVFDEKIFTTNMEDILSKFTSNVNVQKVYVKDNINYIKDNIVVMDLKCDALEADFNEYQTQETIVQLEVVPDYVTENKEKVTLPKQLSNESFTKEIWKEYGDRCIACGRCNFVCPTCTCFTMQDIFYQDNAKVGERRRVWASLWDISS